MICRTYIGRSCATLGLAAGLCIAQAPADKTTDKAPASDTTRNRTESTASKEMLLNEQEAMFLKEAAMGGMMEVQAAQTAQQKASSAEVKEFAKKIEQDHMKANDDLKALAKQKGVELPSEVGPKHQAHLTKMQSASNFDRTWLKMQVDHHRKDVSSFQKQSARSMDSDVKAFVDKTLPALQAHLAEVQQLSAKK